MTNQVACVEVLVPVSEVNFQGQTFSIYGTYENPLFLAKDVATWIDYSKNGKGSYKTSQMLKNVDEDEKGVYNVVTPGGTQEAWFLTEQGMYEVLLQSRKPVAKEAKKVVKQHMKELRMSGVTLRQNLSIEQQSEVLLSKLDELLNQQEEELALLTSQIDELGEQAVLLEEEIGEVDQKIQELKPYADKYKEFLEEDALMTVEDFARIMHPRYNLGRNQLFQFMRNKRMLGSSEKNHNMPHRKLVKMDILKPVKGLVFITKKGFDYLCDALDKHFGL